MSEPKKPETPSVILPAIMAALAMLIAKACVDGVKHDRAARQALVRR